MTENRSMIPDNPIFEFDYPKSLLELILDAGASYICVKDREGRFVYINKQDASLYQTTPDKIIGKTIEPWVGREQFLQWQQDDLAVLDSKEPKHYPLYSRVDKAGNTHWFETVKIPFLDEANQRTLLLIIHSDVTVIKNEAARRELSLSNLAQDQKKELICLLTGNIAHDFNNLLAIIRSSAEIIHADPITPGWIKQSADTIIETSKRAATIITRMLMLAGKDFSEFETIDMNSCLEENRELWSALLPERVKLRYNLKSSPSCITGDRAMLEQALLQLILNARDAISGEGEIQVLTTDKSTETGERLVCVNVSDNGVGMDEETQKKIFQPLYTSKPPGQGVGLGLTLVENIVNRHQGKIYIKSALGSGSSFNLEFQAVNPSKISPHVKAPINSQSLLGKKILIAEDEDHLRTIFARVLSAQGADVITASNGQEAWDLLRESEFGIDCLVTDIVMQGEMDGVSLRRQLAAVHPDIPAIIMSAHSFEYIHAEESMPERTKMLQKPFGPETLAHLLQEFFSENLVKV